MATGRMGQALLASRSKGMRNIQLKERWQGVATPGLCGEAVAVAYMAVYQMDCPDPSLKGSRRTWDR